MSMIIFLTCIYCNKKSLTSEIYVIFLGVFEAVSDTALCRGGGGGITTPQVRGEGSPSVTRTVFTPTTSTPVTKVLRSGLGPQTGLECAVRVMSDHQLSLKVS